MISGFSGGSKNGAITKALSVSTEQICKTEWRIEEATGQRAGQLLFGTHNKSKHSAFEKFIQIQIQLIKVKRASKPDFQ
jgi:hypothetical protein